MKEQAMDAQTHEDRRREMEAAHPIVDEAMTEGMSEAVAPRAPQRDRRVVDDPAKPQGL
jgi:hypothetical protein